MGLILYPIVLFNFWFFESPIGLLNFYKKANIYFLNILSFPLLLKTFFKPLKNEYRKGFIGFSVGMGIFIKTFLIIIDMALFLIFLGFELTFLLAYLAFPIYLIYFFFK